MADERERFDAWWFAAPMGDTSYEDAYGRSYREVAFIAWQISANRFEEALKAQRAAEWQPIETAPKNKTLLVGYFNSHNNWRTVRGCYYSAGVLPMGDEFSDIADDDGYAPEGWYEECDSQENILPVEFAPTHWQLLPPPPALIDKGERNQCDGCARGLPTNSNGIHHGPGAWDMQACTKDRYASKGAPGDTKGGAE